MRYCLLFGLLFLVVSCQSTSTPVDPPWATEAARLHGNMGPGVIAGAIVGHDAMNRLDHPKPWDVRVVLYLPKDKQIPGYRCILDGLQSTTGATMGKANIALRTTPSNQGRQPTVIISVNGRPGLLVYQITPTTTNVIDCTNYSTMHQDSWRLLDSSSVFSVVVRP